MFQLQIVEHRQLLLLSKGIRSLLLLISSPRKDRSLIVLTLECWLSVTKV